MGKRRRGQVGDYEQFVKQIKNKLDIDLTCYKETQMKRRLTSFCLKKGFTSFNDLYQVMTSDDALEEEFLDRMTINVSSFFRNYKRWVVFESTILPKLLEKNRRLKIWSAACSTGEEPYTIAMILSKYVPLHSMSILATDIDASALAKAKEGRYLEQSLKEVPASMKSEFFEIKGDHYEIDDSIKQAVTFQKHNLLADRFQSNFDLIVCRNVTIYFTDDAKDRLYKKFSDALRKDGILFVGSTEQIFDPNKYHFEKEETFFYRKM